MAKNSYEWLGNEVIERSRDSEFTDQREVMARKRNEVEFSDQREVMAENGLEWLGIAKNG